jgi:hypothetical protein
MFQLATYDGHAIPADIGELPPFGGSTTGCRMLVTEGSLDLNATTGSFLVQMITRNSCTGAILSDSRGSGVYEQDGLLLRFLYDGDGTLIDEGFIQMAPSGPIITIVLGEPVLTFQ